MYDPFILSGESPLHVQRKLGECLLAMYALNKLADEHDPQSLWKVVYELAAEYFHYDYSEMNLDANFGAPCIQMRVENSTWHIEMPRVALVGSATK